MNKNRMPREASGEAPKWEILLALTIVLLIYAIIGLF